MFLKFLKVLESSWKFLEVLGSSWKFLIEGSTVRDKIVTRSSRSSVGPELLQSEDFSPVVPTYLHSESNHVQIVW